jgi:molybdate/tungstate transport system substrate-binding protein
MKTAANATFPPPRAAIIAVAAILALVPARLARAARPLTPLAVAYAGSMGSMIDGAIRPAVAAALDANLRGRAQGSTGLARMIAAGSIRPDVFIAVTPGPMRTVIAAGKTARAFPIARTEMVIAYSPHSRFARQFAHAGPSAGAAAKPWWQILETPGLRFGRTDPDTDPLGLNIIFTMQLAAAWYHQPDLVAKILGPQFNPGQIFMEPQLMARLQAGQLDASAAYKTQPGVFGLPFVTLPAAINLGDAAMEPAYQHAVLTLNGTPRHPSPLIFYAAVMNGAAHPRLAARFVAWLQGDSARRIFAQYHYDPPGDAKPLAQ